MSLNSHLALLLNHAEYFPNFILVRVIVKLYLLEVLRATQFIIEKIKLLKAQVRDKMHSIVVIKG